MGKKVLGAPAPQVNEVAKHICEKFDAYAAPRGIRFDETPHMCMVEYNGKTKPHMTVAATAPESALKKSLPEEDVAQMIAEAAAEKNPKRKTATKGGRIPGYLVNMGDKRIRFFKRHEVLVRELPASPDAKSRKPKPRTGAKKQAPATLMGDE